MRSFQDRRWRDEEPDLLDQIRRNWKHFTQPQVARPNGDGTFTAVPAGDWLLDALESLRDEYEEYRKISIEEFKIQDRQIKELGKLHAENARLREALGKYADEKNWGRINYHALSAIKVSLWKGKGKGPELAQEALKRDKSNLS